MTSNEHEDYRSVDAVVGENGWEERRRHPRRRAKGRVVLTYNDHESVVIDADLLDVGESGFRAEYGSQALKAGRFVRYRRGEFEGEARVVWTRWLNGKTQSGLAVLSEQRVH